MSPRPLSFRIAVFLRIFGTWRRQLFAKQFYVVNQLGAGSKTATGMVATSPADGYTPPVVSTGFAIAALVGALP